ncbi:hypothetical protein ACJX0J_022404, partial [Zea mays]
RDKDEFSVICLFHWTQSFTLVFLPPLLPEASPPLFVAFIRHFILVISLDLCIFLASGSRADIFNKMNHENMNTHEPKMRDQMKVTYETLPNKGFEEFVLIRIKEKNYFGVRPLCNISGMAHTAYIVFNTILDSIGTHDLVQEFLAYRVASINHLECFIKYVIIQIQYIIRASLDTLIFYEN